MSTASPARDAAPAGSPQARASSAESASTTSAVLAKAALRRLALERLEPTPENFAQAYAAEARSAGAPTPVLPEAGRLLLARLASTVPGFNEAQATALAHAGTSGQWDLAQRMLEGASGGAAGESLARLVERIVRGLERGGRHWTAARKKDSLQRVLDGSRHDAQRLQTRLAQLVASWDHDAPDAQADAAAPGGGPVEARSADAADVGPAGEPPTERAVEGVVERGVAATGCDTVGATRDGSGERLAASVDIGPWRRMTSCLGGTVVVALPPSQGPAARVPASTAPGPEPAIRPGADALGERIEGLTRRLQSRDATPADAEELEALCSRADRLIAHRQRLLDQLGDLTRELTDSLADLAEDDSWAQGQCVAMRSALEGGLSVRGVRSVGELLRVTRERQLSLRQERDRARDALKGLINRMLSELGELGSQTGRFHESVGRYADVIERADSLESLAGVVREMVEESRTVASLVDQTQQRLQDEHRRASDLNERVQHLEGELRRLSAEVATDPLTQVANRRGMVAEFEVERARHERDGLVLSVGLIDIDNFKRLNDELGHAAGDVALKSLAHAVRDALRPTDRVARFGGEEFVVMLPATAADEAQQVLTRVQRSLSGSLFLHESRPVFVTFSAGVTAYRSGETLEAALERADVALYEAKRTGKNRTCLA
jgi:diguanylate cyclase